MTRKELARSIVSHVKNMVRIDSIETYTRFPECFYVKIDAQTFIENRGIGIDAVLSEHVVSNWPKLKLEQVLFDVLREELDRVKLSSYQTDRALSIKQKRNESLIDTGMWKAVEYNNSSKFTLTDDGLGFRKVQPDEVVRDWLCSGCMWSLRNGNCINPLCSLSKK